MTAVTKSQGGYFTTNREAAEAAAKRRERDMRVRAIEDSRNPEQAIARRARVDRADGLDRLLQRDVISADHHRAARRLQSAQEIVTGQRGRNALNPEPSGDRDNAMIALIEAGKLMDRFARWGNTGMDRHLWATVVRLGWSVDRAMSAWNDGRAVSGRRLESAGQSVAALLEHAIKEGL